MSFFSSKLIPNLNLKNQKPKNKNKGKSQMKNLIDKDSVNVAIVNDKAYWVHNNTFYTAVIMENGEIDADNATPVDVFTASKKEAKNLLKILDSLKEK
jgi:hypothetical protein